jgi:hypothetical protein
MPRTTTKKAATNGGSKQARPEPYFKRLKPQTECFENEDGTATLTVKVFDDRAENDVLKAQFFPMFKHRDTGRATMGKGAVLTLDDPERLREIAEALTEMADRMGS